MMKNLLFIPLLLLSIFAFSQNQKISAMTPAVSLSGPELIPIVQGGVNKTATPNLLSSFAGTGLTFTFSATAPVATTVAWIDTGSAVNQAYPIRYYINGAWTPVTDDCDWWDTIGLVVSHGKPFVLVFSGQSNAAASTFTNAGYTGDVTVNKLVTYWDEGASVWRIYDFASNRYPGQSEGAPVLGTTEVHTFALLYAREFNRSIRVVGTRAPGVPLAGATTGVGWETSTGTEWLRLVNRVSASGITYADVFHWVHGEAGLGASTFSNYQDGWFDFLSRLRALSWMNYKTKVLFYSNGIDYVTPTVDPTGAEGTARGLDYDLDPYTAFVKAIDIKDAGADAFHFTVKDRERFGAAAYSTYKSLPDPYRRKSPLGQWNTFTGNLLTSNILSYPNIDDFRIQHQSKTNNGTGTFSYDFGAGGAVSFPTKIVAKGTGSSGRVDYEIWQNGSNTTATVSDLTVRFNYLGVQFSKPVNTALHSMVNSTANNSGDAALTFNHDATITGTTQWGRTGIVARATGSFSQANLHFFGGTTSASTANLVTDTRLFLNLSTTATSLTLGNNATPIATIGAVQPALSGANLLPAFRINAGAHTTGNTGERIDWYFNGARAVQLNTGNFALWRLGYGPAPTISFVGASVVTDVYGWYFGSAVASTNATFTNNHALGLEGNLSLLPETSTSRLPFLKIREGANGSLGVATLVGGTVTVSNTRVTANSRIFITVKTPGGTQGFLSYSVSAATSFTITSTSGTETSTVNWFIVEPN
jgi:hypothetical protein